MALEARTCYWPFCSVWVFIILTDATFPQKDPIFVSANVFRVHPYIHTQKQNVPTSYLDILNLTKTET